MSILALILATLVNSVISFPKPEEAGHGGFGYVVSTSAQNLANCQVIRSSDYDDGDEYESKCETVQVYELCIPTRSQGCHLFGI